MVNLICRWEIWIPKVAGMGGVLGTCGWVIWEPLGMVHCFGGGLDCVVRVRAIRACITGFYSAVLLRGGVLGIDRMLKNSGKWGSLPLRRCSEGLLCRFQFAGDPDSIGFPGMCWGDYG